MSATITKGQTFATTEQITNAKLHALVDSATISGILASEMANNFLTSLASASGLIPLARQYMLTSLTSAMGKVPPQNLWEYKNLTTNTSIPDLSVGTLFKLNTSTYACIASFTNMRVGQKFTLIAGQASYPGICDTGVFLLNADWVAAKAGDNLTLVWDGVNFIEVGRVAV